MNHVSPAQLQQFLVDSADDAVAAHVQSCTECAELLATIAADDDTLVDALRLNGEELAWATSLDLTQPVLSQLDRWYQHSHLQVVVLSILLGGSMMEAGQRVFRFLFAPQGTVGFTINLSEWVLTLLVDFVRSVNAWNMIATLSLLLLLVGFTWISYRMKEEDHPYA
jgi:hypothetical protein